MRRVEIAIPPYHARDHQSFLHNQCVRRLPIFTSSCTRMCTDELLLVLRLINGQKVCANVEVLGKYLARSISKI